MAGTEGRRERRARLIGVAVALASMAAFSLAIGWPAPAISVGLGFGAYLLARGTRQHHDARDRGDRTASR